MIREGMQIRINQGWVLLQCAQQAVMRFIKFECAASNPKQPVQCATLIAPYLLCSVTLMFAIAGCSAPTITNIDLATLTPTKLDAEYAQPIVSVDEVINPKSSMEGGYPVHSAGMYGGPFFWMDNHRIIFTGLEKDIRQLSANEPLKEIIKIWDLDSGKIVRYAQGGIGCYSDGIAMVRITKNRMDSLTEPLIRSIGPLGHEVPTDLAYRRYIYPDECVNEPSSFIKDYMDVHPDEVVSPLRREHGLLVVAKREKEGQTFRALEQDAIIFHAPGKEPQRIPIIPWFRREPPPYFAFADAYAFFNYEQGEKDTRRAGRLLYRKNAKGETESFAWDPHTHLPEPAYMLSVDGMLHTAKVPDFFLKGYGASGPYLTRRGLLWIVGHVIPNPDHGFYISRGEKVKKISSASVWGDAKVSPDGCHVAYLDVPRNHGQYEGILKTMDLCKGEQ